MSGLEYLWVTEYISQPRLRSAIQNAQLKTQCTNAGKFKLNWHNCNTFISSNRSFETPRSESTLKWIRASKHYLVCTKTPSFNHCLSKSIYKCFTNNLWVFMASLGLVRTIAVARTHVISQMEKFQLHELKLRWFSPHYKHLQDWGNFNVCISFK